MAATASSATRDIPLPRNGDLVGLGVGVAGLGRRLRLYGLFDVLCYSRATGLPYMSLLSKFMKCQLKDFAGSSGPAMLFGKGLCKPLHPEDEPRWMPWGCLHSERSSGSTTSPHPLTCSTMGRSPCPGRK